MNDCLERQDTPPSPTFFPPNMVNGWVRGTCVCVGMCVEGGGGGVLQPETTASYSRIFTGLMMTAVWHVRRALPDSGNMSFAFQRRHAKWRKVNHVFHGAELNQKDHLSHYLIASFILPHPHTPAFNLSLKPQTVRGQSAAGSFHLPFTLHTQLLLIS